MSSLKFYPILALVCIGIAALLLVTKGGPVIRILEDVFQDRYTEREIILGLMVVLVVFVALGLMFLLMLIIQERIFYDYYYCEDCNAVDRSNEGACPFCDKRLIKKDTFFYTHYSDEISLAREYGLIEAKED